MTAARTEAIEQSGRKTYPKPGERLIGIPIGAKNMVFVPSAPQHTDILPIVTRMFGTDVNKNTQTRREEIMFVGSELPDPDEDPIAARISSVGPYSHTRSITFLRPETLTGKEITDEDTIEIEINGIKRKYSAVSSKGADASNVYLQNDLFEFRVSRLVIRKYSNASVESLKWIQDNIPGINTEVIWSISRPDKLPITRHKRIPYSQPPEYTTEVELVSQEEYKEWLLERAISLNESGEYRRVDPYSRKIDIDKAREYLERVDFVIENRAHTVPFRLSDLLLPFTKKSEYTTKQGPAEDFVAMMNYMISYLNLNKDDNDKLRKLKIPQNENDFLTQIENNRAIFRFFYHSARNLGTQIGLIHSHEIVHDFLHPGNILGDGNFCDADSLKGRPLGDNISESSIVYDAYNAMQSLYLLVRTLNRAGLITRDQTVGIGKQFAKQYLSTRGTNQSFDEALCRKELIELANEKKPSPDDHQRLRVFTAYKRWVEEILIT